MFGVDVSTSAGGQADPVGRAQAAEDMDFRLFWTTYEDIVRRARAGKLTVDDFQGLKLRSSTTPNNVEFFRALGASPVPPGVGGR